MKSQLKKRLWCLLLSLMLLGLWLLLSDAEGGGVPLTLRLRCGDSTQELLSQLSEEGSYQVFLPAHADADALTLRCYGHQPLLLDGAPLRSGQTLADIDLTAEHTLTVGEVTYPLTFYQSDHTATLYLTTQSGTMDAIYADQNHREAVSALLCTEAGQVDFSLRQGITLSGRGNSTWNLRKKPFSLRLERPASLLGMEESRHWILLANGYDTTNLRNKLVYDFAAQHGSGWVPGCEYVELYLNGSYNGLYLLSERVDAAHLGEEDTPPCLMNLNQDYKLSEDAVSFTLESGRLLEVNSPKDIKDSDLAALQERMQRIDTLLSSTAEDKAALEQLIDVDSWARRYILDEIFLNADGDLSSSYFYWDMEDASPVYAGPVWDYDLSVGNTNKWVSYYAYGVPTHLLNTHRPWYRQVMQWPAFRDRVETLYREEYADALQELLSRTLPTLETRITAATAMNAARWPKTVVPEPDTDMSGTERLNWFLTQRAAFLDQLWLEHRDFVQVRFNTLDTFRYPYLYYSVERGTVMTTPPDMKQLGMTDFAGWADEKTGEPFDLSAPITKNRRLIALTAPADAASQKATQNSTPTPTETTTQPKRASLLSRLWRRRERILLLGTAAGFGLCFSLLLVADLRRKNGQLRH